MKSGIDLTTILNKNEENEEKQCEKIDNSTIENVTNTPIPVNNDKSSSEEAQNQTDQEIEPLKRQLEEASSRGKVKGSLLVKYFKCANRPFTFAFLVISFLLAQILASVSDVWVSYW